MSSTWRYVSEARGHLVEIYERLLDMPQERPRGCFVGLNPNPMMVAAYSKAADEWHDLRVAKVMNIVDVLGKHDIREAITDWREHAIAYLRKTPSARSKQKFHDDDDSILFLCVTLWYARVAVDWLVKRDDEGLLQGGISYRDMTAKAAEFGSREGIPGQDLHQILPEEARIVDELDKDDPRLARYLAWTYISLDIDHFL
ncbi:hypothetical protein [Vogesella sp. XCS3]|uniref:hypothetical protein n=1 Tax=Vogesella sp. XCS3 TaxID=2877939 RepID=UPI001D0A279A|nr:hypothetical protein [Vogesella sp. XCS3]UDM18870.1 hypothetical protein LCH97_18545 [Vogesella sp. XCS3]